MKLSLYALLLVLCLVPAVMASALSPMLPEADSGSSGYQHPTGSGYHLLNQFAIGGDGGWDYLTCDPDAGRLYIARDSRVQVVDLAQGKVVGEVANTPGVHGVALDTKRHHGFTSNGKENSVTVFGLKDLAELHRIPVGTRPDAIVFDPASKRVFTLNGGSNDVTAIDAVKLKVVGTLPLGGRPEFAAVDGHGMLFVNMVETSEIVAIDAAKLTILHRWPLAPGEHPSGLTIDPEHHRLFSVCGGGDAKMIVLDSRDGRMVANLPIGKGPDAAAFDPQTGLAFASCGRDGVLTVVREDAPDTLNAIDTVTTQQGARTMALNTKTHRVYVVTARFITPPAGPEHPADTTPPTGTANPTGTALPVGPERHEWRDFHVNIEPNSFVVLEYAPAPRARQHNGSGQGGGRGGHRGGRMGGGF